MYRVLKRIVFIAVIFSLSSNVVIAADKKIGIIVFDGVLTSDITAPLEVFGAAAKKTWFSDYDVVVISVEKAKNIKTEEGLVLGVDTWIGDDIELDMLVVPSAYEMTSLLENKQLIKFIQKADETTQLTTSNCSGSFLLAQSGILNGKNATTWAGGEGDLQKQFPKVNAIEGENVVVDGKYITSNGSIVSYESALVALAKLSSKSNAKEIFEGLQMERVTTWERVENLF